MFGYIYLTTVKPTGELYVGQHHGDFDPNYCGSGTKISAAIAVHGRSSVGVELLCECTDQKDMDEKEIEYIAVIKSSGSTLLNVLPGGAGVSPKTMNVISLALKGRPKSDAHRMKMSITRLGRKHRKKRKAPSPETLKRMSDAQKGKKHSDETRRKMSESQRKRPRPSEETRQRLKATWAKRKEMLQVALAKGISIGIHDINLTKRSRRIKHDTNQPTESSASIHRLDLHPKMD